MEETLISIKDQHLGGKIVIDYAITAEKKQEILAAYPVPQLGGEDGKTFDIKTQSHGDYVFEVLSLLNSHSIEPTQKGGKYLKMEFSNRMGRLPAKMWDDNKGGLEHTSTLLDESSVFVISGKIEQYPRETGPKTIVVDRIFPFEGKVNPFDLIPSTEKNLEDLTLELVLHLEELEEPFRSIALQGLKKYWTEFSIKPAATGMHHNYLSGLLKHTLGLIRIARYIRNEKGNPYNAMDDLINYAYMEARKERNANLNAEVQLKERDFVWKESVDHFQKIFNGFAKHRNAAINFDAVICAILFHDIGKIQEYSHAGEDAVLKFQWLYPNADYSSFSARKETGITMDPMGMGTGHIPFGILMLRNAIVEEDIKVKIEDISLLNHCIAAHHGKLEWGSAAWMDAPESFIVHFVDYMDSRYEKIDAVK